MAAPKTIAAALTCGTLLGVAAASIYRADQPVFIDFERGYESAFVENFHPRERAGDGYFRWTKEKSTVVVENLPSGGVVTVRARLLVAHPSGSPSPELVLTANGVTVYRAQAPPGLATHETEFPLRWRRLELGIETDTFVAGDGRRLGVRVLGIRVEPSGGERAGWPAVAWTAASGLAWFAAFTAAGLSTTFSLAVALAVGAAFCFVLSQQAVPFTSYPYEVFVISAAALVIVLVARALFSRLDWPRQASRPAVLAVLALSFAVKLGALAYPLWLSSDAEFQANRFREYRQGEWHPSSVTQHQPPFRIPYPVSLFVVTEPLVAAGADPVRALKLVTLVLDWLAGASLMFIGWRFLGDLRAGVVAAFIFHVLPIGWYAFSAGNFTNIFALSTLTLAFSYLLGSHSGGGNLAIVSSAVLTLVSLTAHFGLLLEGVLLFPLWLAGVLLLVPGSAARSHRGRLAVAMAVSLAVAAVYYLGYRDLVIEQWWRALGGDEDASGSPVAARWALLVGLLDEQVGWVVVATTIVGAIATLGRRGLTSAFHAGVSVWVVVSLVFLVLDLSTRLEIRYVYQALPVMALLSGRALSLAWNRSRLGKAAASAIVLYLAIRGTQVIYECMTLRYH